MTMLHVYALWPAIAASVNRTEQGRQKTTLYGGVPRARWSSQSQKARTREAFAAGLDATAPLTRRWDLIGDALVARGVDPVWAQAAAQLSWELATGGDSGLALVAEGFADRVAEAAIEHEGALRDEYTLGLSDNDGDDTDPDVAVLREGLRQRKSEVESRLGKGPKRTGGDREAKDAHKRALNMFVAALLECKANVDIAVNGRMVAQHPRFNVTPAVQVSHAISVEGWHESNVDYFTAYDRLGSRSESGTDSAMIGTRPNGTALYYRYANFNTEQAAFNLSADPADMTGHALDWARAFLSAIPISYQSSTGTGTPPIFAGLVVSPQATANVAPFCHSPITGSGQYARAIGTLLGQHLANQSWQVTGTLHYWSSVEHEPVEASRMHATWADVVEAARGELTGQR